MRQNSEESFLQPVIATLGLAISIITSLSPIFSKNFIGDLFLEKKLSNPSSFFAFIFGITIIWMIINYYRYINLSIGKLKDRGRGFNEPLFYFDNKFFLILFLIIGLITGFIFLYLGIFVKKYGDFVPILQAISYDIFYFSIISLFTFLFTSTQDRYRYNENRQNFPNTLLETLSRNGLISVGIQLHENRQLAPDELLLYGKRIPLLGMTKYIRLRTIKQKDEFLEVIVSNDGKEIIKIIKRQEIKEEISETKKL